MAGGRPEAEGTPYASRFSGPEWSKFPFNLLAQSFLTVSGVAREAVRQMPGLDADAEGRVGFTLREDLEVLAPDNYLPTNPKLIEQTVHEHGRNLLRGVTTSRRTSSARSGTRARPDRAVPGRRARRRVPRAR